MIPDWPVDRLAVVDSTNSEAKRRASAPGFRNHWIVADQQTAGRGREAHTWASPIGNLYATALFLEPQGLAVALRLPFAAALAVSDTILAIVPAAPVGLKWPNDVRIAGKKISGILIETGRQASAVWVAAGIGINISTIPENIGQPVTSLHAIGATADIPTSGVIDILRSCFADRLAEARDSFAPIRHDWISRAEGLGARVRVVAGGSVVEGIFETLDPDGGLVLQLQDGGRRIIRAGEINLLGGL